MAFKAHSSAQHVQSEIFACAIELTFRRSATQLPYLVFITQTLILTSAPRRFIGYWRPGGKVDYCLSGNKANVQKNSLTHEYGLYSRPFHYQHLYQTLLQPGLLYSCSSRNFETLQYIDGNSQGKKTILIVPEWFKKVWKCLLGGQQIRGFYKAVEMVREVTVKYNKLALFSVYPFPVCKDTCRALLNFVGESKEQVSKFNSKKEKTRNQSAFMKHPINSHGGREQEKKCSDYFEIPILKAYTKAFTQSIEEGTYIASHQGEVLNSNSEWHQTKAICTTTLVVEG